MPYKHLFGPVASRRLGRSLGVDMVPVKTCPFDCIYCEVGRTTNRTVTRQHFFDADEILAELVHFFDSGGEADFLTLTGSGEPTLSLDIAEVIHESRRRFGLPVAVITNGALLGDEEVGRDLAEADIVMPSLDSAREESFKAVNRPAAGITAAGVVEGLAAFRRGYEGRLWLEILLVEGVNDSHEDVEALAAAVEIIRPDRVQLNTVVRPCIEKDVHPLPHARLEEIAAWLSRSAPVEIIAAAALATGHMPPSDPIAAVLETLKRRPCTADDLASALTIAPERVGALLEGFVRKGAVRRIEHDGTVFYEAREPR